MKTWHADLERFQNEMELKISQQSEPKWNYIPELGKIIRKTNPKWEQVDFTTQLNNSDGVIINILIPLDLQDDELEIAKIAFAELISNFDPSKYKVRFASLYITQPKGLPLYDGKIKIEIRIEYNNKPKVVYIDHRDFYM